RCRPSVACTGSELHFTCRWKISCYGDSARIVRCSVPKAGQEPHECLRDRWILEQCPEQYHSQRAAYRRFGRIRSDWFNERSYKLESDLTSGRCLRRAPFGGLPNLKFIGVYVQR